MGAAGAQTGDTCRPLTGQQTMRKGGMATSGKCRSLGTLATFRDGSRAPSDRGRQGCISQPSTWTTGSPPLADHAKGQAAECPPRSQICRSFLTWMVLPSSTARNRDVYSWHAYSEDAKTVAARAKLLPTRNCRLAASARTQPRQPTTGRGLAVAQEAGSKLVRICHPHGELPKATMPSRLATNTRLAR